MQISRTESPVISKTFESSNSKCSVSLTISESSIFGCFSFKLDTIWNRNCFSEAIVTSILKRFSNALRIFSFLANCSIELFHSVMYFLVNEYSVGLKSLRKNGSLTCLKTILGMFSFFAYSKLSCDVGSFSSCLKSSTYPSRSSLSGSRKIWRWENRDFTRFSSSSTTSRRCVIPRTQIGVWADWATSNKLYSNVWLWCAQKRSNSSMIKINRCASFPKNLNYFKIEHF